MASCCREALSALVTGVPLAANSSTRFESSFTVCSSGAIKNADAGMSCDGQTRQ